MTCKNDHTGANIPQRLRALPWLILCTFLLAACASGPAPVSDRSYGARQSSVSGEPGVYVVRRGETVYGIAQRYDVSTRALIERNNLRPPYLLIPGARLRLPTTQIHTVRRGETVYAVSRQHGVDMASLARANRLQTPYRIYIGQRLVLPLDAVPAEQIASAQPRAATREPVTRTRPRTPAPSAGPSTGLGSGPVAGPTLGKGLPRPRPNFRPTVPVPRRDSAGFLWPVEGRILSSFGAKKSGLHNDGLNIAAPRGAPVRAADNGVVAYAGNQIRGFGNMLLIKHSGGLITAYAHADKLLVTRGDVVSRGQVVARVGKTGDIEAPQLHFEVRKGRQAVDPRKFLPS